jgi:hypothetical protein
MRLEIGKRFALVVLTIISDKRSNAKQFSPRRQTDSTGLWLSVRALSLSIVKSIGL